MSLQTLLGFGLGAGLSICTLGGCEESADDSGNSDGPYLEETSGTASCTADGYRWALAQVRNVGESGTADITVTVTDGTSSYVEHKQFPVIADTEYGLEMRISADRKSSMGNPGEGHVFRIVVSQPGSSSDLIVMNELPKLQGNTTPMTYYWYEATGPSVTTIVPSSQTWPDACGMGD